MTSPHQLDRFRRLAFITTGVTLLLTGAGALVRGTGSGLGCLDEWPTCRGGWVAPTDYQGIIEYTHRAIAGVVVLLLVALVIGARRWLRDEPRFFALSLVGLGVVITQALIGRVVVTSGLHAALVTAHFVTALALVAVVTTLAAWSKVFGRPAAEGSHRKIAIGATAGVAVLLPLLLVGAYVREKGAGLAFSDWPLMGGALLPDLSRPGAVLHFAHRVLALVALGHLVSLAIRARRDSRPAVRNLALVGAALFVLQAIVGATNVWSELQPAPVVAHATLAYVTWAVYIALVVVARRGRGPVVGDGTSPPRAPGVSDRVPSVADHLKAYVMLTKPRIITLLLITTVPAMVLAERGIPSLGLIAATLWGGMLTAGSANAFNQYLERDIDVKMERTKGRPLPAHNVTPSRALAFAFVVGIAGCAWLWIVVNPLSSLLAAAAIAFYVVVYTVLLKRNTPQNIVIGGAAGAAPVLIGWAAVTGTVEAPAWVMFAIVFLWTPPHFWALAMRYRDDYAAAEVPMMPVVRGDASTTLQILLYAIVLVVSTLVLSPVGGLGVLYAVTAVALGAGFLYRAFNLRAKPSAQAAFGLFKYSISYLAILFASIAVDRLVW